MTIVLVEGESDATAVRILAARIGLPVPRILVAGGSKGARRVAEAPGGERLVGLVDAAQGRDFESVLDTVFACDPDLEGEFVGDRGAGVEAVIAGQGELASFRRLQAQPFQRVQAIERQLARFFGARSGNKVRYARLLAETVVLESIPAPLSSLLSSL